VSPALLVETLLTLVALAVGEPVRDTAWARALPEGSSVVLPAGHYVGPWRFTHRIRLTAEPGAMLVPGPGDDPGHATLTLEQGGQLEGLAVEAPAKGYAVRVERSSATLKKLHLTGGGVAGLYFVGSKLEVSGSEFEGNQYGVLSEGPSSLELQKSRFHGVYRAGVALVGTSATFMDNAFVGPFFEAAVTAIHCDPVRLSGTRVTAAGEIGLKFVTSKAVIEEARVEGVRSDKNGLEGNALYSFQSTLDVSGLWVDDTQGVGVSVSGGHVTLRHSELHRCSEVAVNVGGGGSLRMSDSLITDSPTGILVDSDGTSDTTDNRYQHVKWPEVKMESKKPL
jgi:hypothetical protein